MPVRDGHDVESRGGYYLSSESVPRCQLGTERAPQDRLRNAGLPPPLDNTYERGVRYEPLPHDRAPRATVSVD